MPPTTTPNPFSFGTTSRTPFSFGAGMGGTSAPLPPSPAAPGVGAAPVAPIAPVAPPTHSFNIDSFLQWLHTQNQQQAPTPPVDFGTQVGGIRKARDPQGEANRGYIPGVNNASNPFSNSFFNS